MIAQKPHFWRLELLSQKQCLPALARLLSGMAGRNQNIHKRIDRCPSVENLKNSLLELDRDAIESVYAADENT